MDDDELLEAFEDCSLTKAEWTHTAHVRVAWLYLARFPEDEALTRMRLGILRFNLATGGDPRAYHETVTRAYVRLIAHRRAARPAGEPFEAFQRAHPELWDRASPLLLRYYRRETLHDRAAFERWVEPDVAPLPS